MNHPVGSLEKYLVARHISVHVARVHVVHDVVGVGVLIGQEKSEGYTCCNAHDDKYVHDSRIYTVRHLLSREILYSLGRQVSDLVGLS